CVDLQHILGQIQSNSRYLHDELLCRGYHDLSTLAQTSRCVAGVVHHITTIGKSVDGKNRYDRDRKRKLIEGSRRARNPAPPWPGWYSVAYVCRLRPGWEAVLRDTGCGAEAGAGRKRRPCQRRRYR